MPPSLDACGTRMGSWNAACRRRPPRRMREAWQLVAGHLARLLCLAPPTSPGPPSAAPKEVPDDVSRVSVQLIAPVPRGRCRARAGYCAEAAARRRDKLAARVSPCHCERGNRTVRVLHPSFSSMAQGATRR